MKAYGIWRVWFISGAASRASSQADIAEDENPHMSFVSEAMCVCVCVSIGLTYIGKAQRGRRSSGAQRKTCHSIGGKINKVNV